MAEPRQSDRKPTLVALGSETQDEAPGRARRRGGVPVVWWVALVAAAAVVAALGQTWRLQQASARIGTLEERVIGLEVQVSAANTQIHTLEMQRGEVREAVADLSERVMLLSEMLAE